MQDVMQVVFDRLVQLMVPFGWELTLDVNRAERRACIDLRTKFPNGAGSLAGKVLNFRQMYHEADLVVRGPDWPRYAAREIAELVMRAAFDQITKALPAG